MLCVLTLASILAASQEVHIDIDRDCPVGVTGGGSRVHADWSADGFRFEAVFDLDRSKPLIHLLTRDGRAVARGIEPRFTVTTGVRRTVADGRYIFFDKPFKKPHEAHGSTLEAQVVRARGAGRRATITFSGMSAGPFKGELAVTLYDGSPILHFEAALAPDALYAYAYDFSLQGDFPRIAWKDTRDAWVRVPAEGEPRPVAVRNRTILAETDGGTLAVFPPPHAFFYPRDYTTNFGFAQVGQGMFGLRQDLAGGKGHQGAFIPWFDGPKGRVQRMGAFILVHGGKAEETLERVKRYTHGDTFKPVDGRKIFTSHWHSKLTVNEMAGTPRAPEFVRLFKAMGVNLVHLAEFHGDGNPRDPGPKRLPELKAMFDMCRKYSDASLLLIPGEEANAHLNHPPPPKQHPGHWLYLFPKPVHLTLVRGKDQPLVEEIAPYGRVYHTGREADMVEVLRREKGLAWTAHPRIKASFAAPDAYKDRDWYKDDTLWLGGAWKFMPGDLSDDGRLGVRVLDLLDDMNAWGQHKKVLGEVDCFTVDATHEIYGNMNVNYLKLGTMPAVDDWSPVLEVLRRGDFFVTTGEILIHSFEAAGDSVKADLEWTFPLRTVELVVDGKRSTIRLPETREFGRRTFSWPAALEGRHRVRLEAWDVASNGAFTQPLRLR